MRKQENYSHKNSVSVYKKKISRTIHKNLKRYSIITAEFKVSHESDKLVEVNVDNGCHGDGGGGRGRKKRRRIALPLAGLVLDWWYSARDTRIGSLTTLRLNISTPWHLFHVNQARGRDEKSRRCWRKRPRDIRIRHENPAEIHTYIFLQIRFCNPSM